MAIKKEEVVEIQESKMSVQKETLVRESNQQTLNQEQLNTRLNNILDAYSIPVPRLESSPGVYPSYDLPTGGDPNSYNPTPSRISTEQSQASETNRNTITYEDVRTTALFERQLNAARSLANLLDILKQASANKNLALQEISVREKFYNESVAHHRETEQTVVDAETNLNRLKKGIEKINVEVSSYHTRIG